jgi:thiamine pyrophosphate-dependent acetolactate synthase large subunit-like protein
MSEPPPSQAPLFKLVAEDLAGLGVTMVFGLISDDTVFLANALQDAGVRLVGARHENMSVAMAEGYAAATGQLGVALIGRGPAAANCVNAAVHASRTGSKVLLIYGDQPVRSGARIGGPDLKRLDLHRLLSAIDIPVFRSPSADGARLALRDAFARASSGGIAALLLPQDVQTRLVAAPEQVEAVPEQPVRPAGDGGSKSIDAAAALIARSRRPLILAGWGAYAAEARADIERLGDAIDAMYCTSLRANGFFAGNSFDLGIIGSFSTSVARHFVEQCDCLIVFGASLNGYTSVLGEALPRVVPIIQIDHEPEHLGRYWRADIAITGDARQVASRLADALASNTDDREFRSQENRARIDSFEPAIDFAPLNTERTIDPRSAALAVNAHLPAQRNVVLDIGNFFQIAPLLSVPDPGRFKYTSDFGSIGLGLGTAIGFALGRPDEITALFIGDGSLLMVLGELLTCIVEDLPIAIFVMNDAALGAERHFLDLCDQSADSALLPMVDFAPIAAQLGFETATVSSPDQTEGLAAILADLRGPTLVDVKINPAVVAPFITERVGAR